MAYKAIMGNLNNEIIFALPKGRILEELLPVLKKTDLLPENEFFSGSSRKLIFNSNHKNIKFIKVRSFDVATFISSGVAQIGVCGNDVVKEFNYKNIYSLKNLNIGHCKLSLAGENKNKPDFKSLSHIKIATKYVNSTKKFFAKQGILAECVKLNGSIELAPKLGLCDYIVDLVSTGRTLKENKMQEIFKISDVYSGIIVNKQAYKTRKKELNELVKLF